GDRSRRLVGRRAPGACLAQARQVIAARARIHAVEPRSRANGPGVRFVVWFQGCTLGCPGCFNPATHAVALDPGPGPGTRPETSIAELAATMAAACASGATGLSLSGGEPLQQPDAARALLDAARALGLSTLAFSGYTIDEIRGLPGGPDVLARLDVLIDGRYVASDLLVTGLRCTATQQFRPLRPARTLLHGRGPPR